MPIFEMIFSILSSVIAATILIFMKLLLDKQKAKQEAKEVKEEVERVVETYKEEPKDILTLMRRNVAELREYYTINKQQARNAFSAAIFVCILGFLLFAAGVILSYVIPSKQGVIQYSTISGAIVELIAGLFFWLYSKAIRQINIFHESLQNTQKFLTGIQLVSNISEDNRDSAYAYIIQNIIGYESQIKLQSNENPLDFGKEKLTNG